ncbi:MAG: hypothetical protein NVS4B11_07680 [Ktedonobacteraceae bacterium]
MLSIVNASIRTTSGIRKRPNHVSDCASSVLSASISAKRPKKVIMYQDQNQGVPSRQ